ncbi:MAG: hypothetical protein ACPHL6_12010, partial [Rubripirellula sp.]
MARCIQRKIKRKPERRIGLRPDDRKNAEPTGGIRPPASSHASGYPATMLHRENPIALDSVDQI